MKKEISMLLIAFVLVIAANYRAEAYCCPEAAAGLSRYLIEVATTPISVEKIQTDKEENKIEYVKIEATAYYNKHNRTCADGTWPEVGTLAGSRKWFGKRVELYRCNKDGTVGELLGTYTFHDTAGRDSPIRKGQAIDIFMNTYDECMNWGRRKVYMKWLD